LCCNLLFLHAQMAVCSQWIVLQFLNLRPKMAKSIVYVITLITNRNHAFHCLNWVRLSFYHKSAIGLKFTMYRYNLSWLTVVELSIDLVKILDISFNRHIRVRLKISNILSNRISFWITLWIYFLYNLYPKSYPNFEDNHDVAIGYLLSKFYTIGHCSMHLIFNKIHYFISIYLCIPLICIRR